MLLATSNALALARERSPLISCQTTPERVATYLLDVVGRRDFVLTEMRLRSQKNVAAFAVSRVDLAGYRGTTFETISQHVHYLVDEGVLLILDGMPF